MSLVPRIRGELAGAWRSVGYDLGRRPSAPVADDGPDVTSTGMHTFPGALVDLPIGPPETDARPPRRFVAVTAFCALAAIGAGGSYVAATTVFAEEPPAVTQAAPGPDRATGGLVSPVRRNGVSAKRTGGGREAMGPVPLAGGRSRTTKPAAPGPVAEAGPVTAPPVAVKPAPTTPAGRRTVAVPPRATRSPSPECHCPTPPVPTPTSLPGSPSAPASPAPATSPAHPSATPSGTASPAPDAGASTGPGDRRRTGTGASDGRHRRDHRPARG